MAPTQRALILAALGLTPRDGVMPRWSSRNEFGAILWRDLANWEKMVAGGLAEIEDHPNFYLFRVTRRGAEAAGVLGRCRREDLGR